jgi:YD repeat-containing protein
MTDREKHELRGLVRSCTEERTYPDLSPSGDPRSPSPKYSFTNEYDIDGRHIESRHQNSDGSVWVERREYDTSGRLLKTTSGNEAGSSTETVHSYDSQGRLLSITNSRSPDSPVTFHYDESGRKTKMQVSRPADYRPNLAVAGSPFSAADRAPNFSDGGSATTFYDERDRAVEVETRDSQGELVSRATRTYDEQGRIVKEEAILASPEMIIPADHRARILKESGASLDELREQLTKLMGGNRGHHSESYTYDHNGRIKQMLRRIFNEIETIETSYNEHGDKASEIASIKKASETEQGTQPSGRPQYSEAHFVREYDGHGNWTKETLLHRSSPDAEFQKTSERRRTLSYH